MRKAKSDLLKKCQECMVNPVADIVENFSLEKSKTFYEKYSEQWNNWNYKQNPVDKTERIEFPFTTLSELSIVAIEAHNLFVNMEKADFIRGLNWRLYGHNVIVWWHRLKTFDEWLHDGLKDALTMHYKDPEQGVRKILEKERWGWLYWNVDIHLWLEWEIDDEAMKRMGRYEPNQKLEDRDVEKDIEEAINILEWGSNKREGDVTVLTLKVK